MRDLPRDLGIPYDYYAPLLYTTFGIDICSFSSLYIKYIVDIQKMARNVSNIYTNFHYHTNTASKLNLLKA